jgi:hypothetical protein
MVTATELLDALYTVGQQQVALTGSIAEVTRADASIVVEGRSLGLLRGFAATNTVLQLLPSTDAVRVIILGGRSGIPVNQELAAMPTAGRTALQVAEETYTLVANYLANSAS